MGIAVGRGGGRGDSREDNISGEAVTDLETRHCE